MGISKTKQTTRSPRLPLLSSCSVRPCDSIPQHTSGKYGMRLSRGSPTPRSRRAGNGSQKSSAFTAAAILPAKIRGASSPSTSRALPPTMMQSLPGASCMARAHASMKSACPPVTGRVWSPVPVPSPRCVRSARCPTPGRQDSSCCAPAGCASTCLMRAAFSGGLGAQVKSCGTMSVCT